MSILNNLPYNKEMYNSVLQALRNFSDEFPENTAALRTDATFTGTVTATNASVGVNGAADPTSSTQVGGSDGTNLRPIKVDSDGTTNVDLTKVSGTAISLGQKVMASSLPVVISSDQSAIPVSFTPSGTQDENLKQVNGVAVNVGIGAAGAGTQRVSVASDSTLTSIGSITSALPAGTNVIGHVIIDGGSTTVVTGNVTVVQPTGTNLHAVVDSSALPTGASTSALQTTGNASLASIDAGIPVALGQGTMSQSLKVVIASDQTSFPVTLGTAAQTQLNLLALEEGGHLASIDAFINAIATDQLPDGLGAKISAQSFAVTIATDQTKIPVTQQGTTSNTGALSKFRSITGSNTGEVIKASTGNYYKIRVVNRALTIIIIKIYDKATAATSADTPFITFTCAAGDGSSFGDEYIIPSNFANGLGFRCVTGTADNDTTSPTTSPIVEIAYL